MAHKPKPRTDVRVVFIPKPGRESSLEKSYHPEENGAGKTEVNYGVERKFKGPGGYLGATNNDWEHFIA